MKLHDMLVETPVPLMDVDDRGVKAGHEGERQCSTCLSNGDQDWYPEQDITIVRHWTAASVDDPSGGKWWWYCPEHLDKWGGRWWPNSHLAPAHLIPPVTHHCRRDIGLGAVCGQLAGENVDGAWFCAEHAEPARVQLRLKELLADS